MSATHLESRENLRLQRGAPCDQLRRIARRALVGDAIAEGKQRAAHHHAEAMAEHDNRGKDKDAADEKSSR